MLTVMMKTSTHLHLESSTAVTYYPKVLDSKALCGRPDQLCSVVASYHNNTRVSFAQSQIRELPNRDSKAASMFYIIGLGLGDAKDVSVKGLEIIKMCDRVYLEAYTSILTCGQQALVGYVLLFVCKYV